MATSATLPTPTIATAAAPTPTVVRVVPWDDATGSGEFDPRSRYVERFWLSVLGPSAVWVLRRLAEGLDDLPEGFDLDLEELAACLGLGRSASRHAPIRRAIGRCSHFGLLRQYADDTLESRRRLPPVPRRHLLRMPTSLQEEHRGWESAGSSADEGLLLRRRARLVALDLRELGVDDGSIERHLLRRGVHPAIAFEAARWAWSPAADADQLSGAAL